MTDPDYQEESELLLPKGGKEDYAWNTRDPLDHLLVLPCSMVKVNGKLKQSHLRRTANTADPSEMRVVSPSQLKNYNQLRYLLRAEIIWNG